MTDRSKRCAVSIFRPNKSPNSLRSVYASAPFKFIVDGEPLYIHADLVSLHSKPLDRLMNGVLAEAQKGCAILEDLDEATFVRFIEWAHKGYYTAAEFAIVEGQNLGTATPSSGGKNDAGVVEEQDSWAEPAPVPEEQVPSAELAPLEEQVPWDVPAVADLGDDDVFEKPWWPSKKSKLKGRIPASLRSPSVREKLVESFVSRRPVERKSAIEVPSPRRNQSPTEDYSEVFLSHARLYVFAEKYDIQPLKMLALDEIHAVLAVFTLYPNRTADIIGLLRYVYVNTCEPREGDEDMRALMTHYVGFEMEMLMEDPEFVDLIIEEGNDLTIGDRKDLLRDFMKMIAERIDSKT